jgi:hypothetical protein
MPAKHRTRPSREPYRQPFAASASSESLTDEQERGEPQTAASQKSANGCNMFIVDFGRRTVEEETLLCRRRSAP